MAGNVRIGSIGGMTVAGTGNAGGRRVQLHRALSKLGLGSRGQAWEWIRAGFVEVDGVTVTEPLTWIDLDRQQIHFQGKAAKRKHKAVVLALHKRRGVVTTRSDERGRPTVYDLLPAGLTWVFPVGRLDADTEGLLILTNDSSLGERLTDPKHRIPKTYHATVKGVPDRKALRQLREGVDLSDGRTLPARVRIAPPPHAHALSPADGGEGRKASCVLAIVLREGRNRQVRRMCAAVGHRVRRLVRVAIGAFALGDLAPGQCRQLNDKEVALLLEGNDAEL